MYAIRRQDSRWHVAAQPSIPVRLRDQALEKVGELPLRVGYPGLPVEDGANVAEMRSAHPGRVVLQNLAEQDGRVGRPLSDAHHPVQVTLDLLLVPGPNNRLDVGEVLVQGGAADAGGLRDLRHRERERPVSANKLLGCLEDRLAHQLPVLADGLPPQLWHRVTIGLSSDELS